jgi:hypothetical protein
MGKCDFIINHRYLVKRYPGITSPIYEIVVLEVTPQNHVKVRHRPSGVIEWNKISDFVILENLGYIHEKEGTHKHDGYT